MKGQINLTFPYMFIVIHETNLVNKLLVTAKR